MEPVKVLLVDSDIRRLAAFCEAAAGLPIAINWVRTTAEANRAVLEFEAYNIIWAEGDDTEFKAFAGPYHALLLMQGAAMSCILMGQQPWTQVRASARSLLEAASPQLERRLKTSP